MQFFMSDFEQIKQSIDRTWQKKLCIEIIKPLNIKTPYLVTDLHLLSQNDDFFL